ncbi:Uncharacterised protein [Sebaldella termitidis]|uniref:Uncharacterized protein n=1 Tax=Sebaldella termitidis (strain ATCC 33386 / NCTC 11300) TaxID=526218 RepID=D1AG92_SEBTE|nr:hypothetical protein [Sebaldella termitidis]ACZ10718.1 hypothetical protein Sterm_3884 [Sebaldella termitidis ATCC 33386]SUI26059.1 Uncharacterised protein [Sebaldella termitidis]
MKIYIISSIVLIIAGVGIYFLYKKKKLKDITEYLVKALDIYGKNLLNKIKLAVLLNTLRAWAIGNTKNKVWKFILELLWPEIDIIEVSKEVMITNNKDSVINSIPDIIVSKTVDNILNNTKYTDNTFSTSTNLKITEKDRGYLEAYLEGQINKLEEARVGIKAGVKW